MRKKRKNSWNGKGFPPCFSPHKGGPSAADHTPTTSRDECGCGQQLQGGYGRNTEGRDRKRGEEEEVEEIDKRKRDGKNQEEGKELRGFEEGGYSRQKSKE